MIEARLADAGPPAPIATADGTTFLATPLADVQPGQAVNAMVRPENVFLCDDDGEVFDNRLGGTLGESLVLGGVVKHFVRTSLGGVFTSVDFNRPGRRVYAEGSAVTLGWHARDMRLLPPAGMAR